MRRTLSFLFSLFFFVHLIYGKEVDVEKAKMVAENFFTQNFNNLKSTVNLEFAYECKSKKTDALKSSKKPISYYYVFNNDKQKGFIVVSADDNALPIIGYSKNASFNVDSIPPVLRKWLENYKDQIRYIIENNLASNNEIKKSWQNLLSGKKTSFKSTQSEISPLLSTQWNQSPYYNAMCPYDSDEGSLTLTGCPATAMAQIMKYWEYPTKGFGFHSYQHPKYGTLSANFGSTYYDWSAMPNSVNSTNDEVARLMYHCGVAVEMNYGVDASGSYVIMHPEAPYSDQQTVQYAFYTYFGYDASAIQGLLRENYTDSEWKSLLKNELDAGRPVQYAGFGAGGHTFVCDGYDQNDYFHMNWGWGGYQDDYWLLDALNPGSGGAGSGAGTYNNGQQALIGIKPPDASQTYEMEIYEDVTSTKTTISYGEGFTISTDILNDGSNAFSGDYSAAVFDDNDVFVDYVEIKTGWSLSPGYHYTNGIDFTTDGLLSMLPGDYTVYIFYRPNGGNWRCILADFWDFLTTDKVDITVEYNNLIELYSSMSLTPSDKIIQNENFSVWLDVTNSSIDDFTGDFDLSLYDLNGDFVETIETKTGMSLSSNHHYTNGLTFSTSNLDVEPGTYLLALLHQWDGYDWELTGSTSSYINPIKIVVQAQPISADIYEINNTSGNSYNFSISFNSDSSLIKTNGSNFHTGSDLDYYNFSLPDGYSYTISARLQDSYNSNDGNTYSVDGMFSYSTDAISWSDSYDDVMATDISISGSKTVYFRVSPYFIGETGSYQLDINIDRSTLNDIPKSIVNNENLSVYPNPVKDQLKINSYSVIETIELTNISGKILLKSAYNSRNIEIDFSDFKSGIYLLKISTIKEITTHKIVKE